MAPRSSARGVWCPAVEGRSSSARWLMHRGIWSLSGAALCFVWTCWVESSLESAMTYMPILPKGQSHVAYILRRFMLDPGTRSDHPNRTLCLPLLTVLTSTLLLSLSSTRIDINTAGRSCQGDLVIPQWSGAPGCACVGACLHLRWR